MNFRRKLLLAWGIFTACWLLCGVISDGSLILLKLRVGGWRAAYVHIALTIFVAVGVPAFVLLIGRFILWIWESLAPSRAR